MRTLKTTTPRRLRDVQDLTQRSHKHVAFRCSLADSRIFKRVNGCRHFINLFVSCRLAVMVFKVRTKWEMIPILYVIMRLFMAFEGIVLALHYM